MRIILFFIICVISCGCLRTPSRDSFSIVWFPNNTPIILGKTDMDAYVEWKRCLEDGYYLGMSIDSIDKEKRNVCKEIGNGNFVCAYKWHYRYNDGTGDGPYTSVFNLKIHKDGIVYSCAVQKVSGYY